MAGFRTVKGFRDFFPEECAMRNYIFETWRRIARRYGFMEYEGPVLEYTDLFRKKSGDEITGQLYCFQDKAEREVSLRPEVTPSLARMVTARHRDFKKPIKWFQIGSCFRYEEPQAGRSREFIQFNADIIGDDSAGADAELVAMSIDMMREFGIGAGEFVIRLSNRGIWTDFLKDNHIDEAHTGVFLQIIDKIERTRPEETAKKLEAIGLSLGVVQAFMDRTDGEHPAFAELKASLSARGMWDFIKIDASIVRGLAYYTGTVFEVFDVKHDLRAVAGGGRYDKLCALMSDGHVDLPSAGFAMGDVVLAILLSKTAGAQGRIADHMLGAFGADVYAVIVDEAQRGHALKAVQDLREAGVRVEYPFSPAKMNKQMQAAEASKARFALIFGAEYPEIVVKNLVNRQQENIEAAKLVNHLQTELAKPALGPLIAG